MHELKSQPPGTESMFGTFTYNDKHLPPTYSLQLSDYQNFLKRLRKTLPPGLRFYGCGEYGEKFGRPHYHIIFFNYRPNDCKLYTRGQDHNLYTSASLDEIWEKGDVKIGDVTFDSCAYVARYCTKKITGPKADSHYRIILPDGTSFNRTPEFATQSRKPGLGFHYYQKYRTEILAHDSVIMNGHEVGIPRYYDKLTENFTDQNMRNGFEYVEDQKIDPETKIHIIGETILDEIKNKRRAKAFKALRNDITRDTPRRGWTKEKVLLAKLKQKTRVL